MKNFNKTVTVAKLITELKKCDQNKPIEIVVSNAGEFSFIGGKIQRMEEQEDSVVLWNDKD